MENCNGSDAGKFTPSDTASKTGSEAVESGPGIRRSSKSDTGFQDRSPSWSSSRSDSPERSSLRIENETSGGIEPERTGDRESPCGEPEPKTSQNQSGRFWISPRSESSSSDDSPQLRSNLTGNGLKSPDSEEDLPFSFQPVSTAGLKSPDSEEDLPFSFQPVSTAGGAEHSDKQIPQKIEDETLDHLKTNLGHCIGGAKKSITAFEEEEKEDLGARYTTTAAQKPRQLAMDVNAEKVTNMKLKHIYSMVYYSILLVLETMKKCKMKDTKTWTDMRKLNDDGRMDVYAEGILWYMKTMRVHTLPFHKYPEPKQLVGLRNAAAHANISYQMWCDDEMSIMELRVQTYQKHKSDGLRSVFRCTYEDLYFICKDIRTAFLKCPDAAEQLNTASSAARAVHVPRSLLSLPKMFHSRVNPTTGKMEWCPPIAEDNKLQEDSDITKELFRSQYGDMLHDTERNQKFYAGVKYAVQKSREMGVEPNVLDIGTGTGLLSLMAAEGGVKKVTACEALQPMAKVARNIILKNGFDKTINVVAKRSTEMAVGPGCDMPERANILVTEMFDTELIGEAALSTFKHAHQQLLKKDSIVVPQTATVIAQLAQSPWIHSSHAVHPDRLPFPLKVPEEWGSCPGPPSQWDLHVEEIPQGDLGPLCPPQHMHMFNFEDPPSLSLTGSSPILDVPISTDGECHCVVVWWETQLAPGVVLSTSPHDPIQWRDHWLQFAQVLPRPITVKKGDVIQLRMHFDEYNIWFDVDPSRLAQLDVPVARPVCTCGSHMVWNRVRLSMLNEPERNGILLSAVKEVVGRGDRVAVFSEGSLLPFMALDAGASKVFTAEGYGLTSRLARQLVAANGVENKVCVLEKSATEVTLEDFGNEKVDAVIGEPFFHASLLPWHNLVFWYAFNNSRPLLREGGKVLPRGAVIRGIAVQFKDLHKIKLPVGVVEGFDLSLFDDARGINDEANPVIRMTDDENVEPHPLWEYPAIAMSEVFPVMSFDFTKEFPGDGKLTFTKEVPVDSGSRLHAVVMWMDLQLTENLWLCRQGPLEAPSVGKQVVWSRTHRQAVCFFPFGKKVNFVTGHSLKFESRFQVGSGNFEVDFHCL